jgi:SAM-dependent methyltransferase
LGCREWSEERIEVRTLERVGEVMRCECGKRYPVVDGVPIVVPHLEGFVRAEIASVVERELPVEVQAMLVEGGPDDAAYVRLVEHVGIYMDAHWGDRAGGEWGMKELVEKIRERNGERVEMAAELGCSVGRVAAEMAGGAEQVVGVDLHFGSLRRARRLVEGERVPYNRKTVGRHYAGATAEGMRANVRFVCGDALDPPLVPRAFGRVVALNLFDSVSKPRQLLDVMEGLCAPGGEIIVSSPYAWASHVMEEDERFGGADPAGALVDWFRAGGRFAIEEEAEVSWTLRRDARSSVSYRTHYVRARKN